VAGPMGSEEGVVRLKGAGLSWGKGGGLQKRLRLIEGGIKAGGLFFEPTSIARERQRGRLEKGEKRKKT